jgi:hypothetical protein
MDTRKTLLLNFTHEIISFIKEKKAIRLVYKGKAEVVSVWENIKLNFSNGFMHLPAIIRMKYYVYKRYGKIVFSRQNVFKRDRYRCQYCNKSLKTSQATMDHIIPKKLGGVSSFENCVAACLHCNTKKGKRLLEDAGMKLINQPTVPTEYIHYVSKEDGWHETWQEYIK